MVMLCDTILDSQDSKSIEESHRKVVVLQDFSYIFFQNFYCEKIP